MRMTGAFDRYLTESEEKKLFKMVRSVSGHLAARDDAWMRLLRYTGMRVGALSQLTCGHAKRAIATAHLDLEKEIQKKKVPHRIFVTKDCEKALRDLLRIRKAMGYAEQMDAPLIISKKKNALSIRSFQSRMAFWREAAGLIGNVSPHWFRHTVAKRIMQNSTAADPRGVVRGILGHTDPRSTEAYTMVDREDVEAAMREVC